MSTARARQSQDYFTAPRPKAGVRRCDHPGCEGEGEHRAPKDREHLTEYYWFCLDHVREYNRAWDYCAGLSEDQIEEHIRRDTTWQRPSWPLGKWATMERQLRDRVVRGAGFSFGAEASEEGSAGSARRHAEETAESKALAVLELPFTASFDEIKARYRQLAKTHHPDANGGDKAAEERLKTINHAYTVLKRWHDA